MRDLEEIEKEESLKSRREEKMRAGQFRLTRIDTKLSMIVPPDFKMAPK